jgi:hypothetical protein
MLAAAVIAATVAPLWAIPPAINIPAGLRDNDFLPVHRTMVRDRIEWWLDGIGNANQNEDVVEYRKRLLADYTFYEEPGYRRQFAEIVARLGGPYITGKAYNADDDLAMVKRVNAAMAMSEMNSPAIQPLLEAMLKSDNAAIRFFGWSGYLKIRAELMSDGVNEKLLASLTRGLKDEPSPVILAEVYQVASLARLGTLSEKAREKVAETLMPQIQAVWDKRLEALDDNEMVMALTEAVETVATYKGEKVVPTARQLILNVAAKAAQAYDAALGEDLERTKLLRKLLEACESGLLELTPLKKRRIAAAFNAADAGAAVQLAVINWQRDLQEGNLLTAE